MEDGQRRVTTMRWGLIPSFVKPGESHDFFRMFNARSETIVHRPAFKRLVPDRRCVVILDGCALTARIHPPPSDPTPAARRRSFYEWKDDGSPVKQPYYLRSRAGGGEPLLLAGLYDVWRPEAGAEPLWSFTICTAEAGKGIEWLHDRMPVRRATQACAPAPQALTRSPTLPSAYSPLSRPSAGSALTRRWKSCSVSCALETRPCCTTTRLRSGVRGALFPPCSRLGGDS